MRAVKHPVPPGNPETLTEPQPPLPARMSLQGLVNQVAGYGVGAVVNRILGIAVACTYPVLLSRDEYGRLDVVFSVVTLLTVLFYIGMDNALPRYYYEQKTAEERKGLVCAVSYSVMGFTVVVSGILLLFSQPLALWLYGDPRYVLCFRLALGGMPFAMLNSMQLLVLRLERRVRAFNILAAANLVISAAFGISSILLFKIGPAGVLAGFVAGNIATGLAGAWVNRGVMALTPLRGYMKRLLDIGMPLVFSGAALWLIGYVNRPLLAHRVDADDLGLYAIASGAAGMLAMMIAAFRNAWQPFAFSIMGREGAGTVYGHALTLFTVIGSAVAVAACLFAPHALLVINSYTQKDWSGAAPVVGPLVMGTVFSAMYFVVQTGVYIARRTGYIAVTMGIAAAANLLLNFLLIPGFGIFGAALATALGHLTALVTLYVAAQRIAPIPYQPVKLMTTTVAAALVMGLAPHLRAESIAADLAVKLGILFLYCGALLATRTITRPDLALFWNISWHGHRGG